MSQTVATFATIFFSMILVNNYVLVQFLGICPFLGVSKKLDSSVGMGAAVIAVMDVCYIMNRSCNILQVLNLVTFLSCILQEIL